MMMSCKLMAAAGVAALALGFAASASAGTTVLYDNGPVNLNDNAEAIDSGFEAANSFTLSKASVVTGMTFAVYLSNPNYSLTSVDWGISTSPFADDGTAILPVETYNPILGTASLAIGPVRLAAGTYWITLSNATQAAGNAGPIFWYESGGPSSAVEAYDGTVLGYPEAPGASDSFQILGTAVPEPATWAMLILGLGMVGFAARRRSQRLTVVA